MLDQGASAASVCPDDDALATFAQGVGPAGERARVDEHVKACRACADVLAATADTCAETGFTDALGRYELVSVIGQGGVGVVHEARDPLLARRVAVKVFHAAVGREVVGESTNQERPLHLLAAGLVTICGLHVVVLVIIVWAVLSPDEGDPGDTVSQTIAGTILLAWTLLGGVLAPVSAVGV